MPIQPDPKGPAKSKLMKIDVSKLLEFLTKQYIPLWLNVTMVLCTGFATYWLAPKINEKFEAQKVRTAFAIETIKSLNMQTSDLLISVDALLEPRLSAATYKERYRIVRDRGLSLQWRLVETRIVFVDDKDKLVVEEFQVSVNKLLSSLPADGQINEPQLEEIRLSVGAVGRKSAKVVSRIAQDAGVGTN
jgi:hypothetical protein